MHDLRHDPTIDPTAERTAFLRQWQPVPPGVKPWGRTVMHQDGNTYTNVDQPAKPSPVAAFDALRDQFGAHFDNVDPEAMVNPPAPEPKPEAKHMLYVDGEGTLYRLQPDGSALPVGVIPASMAEAIREKNIERITVPLSVFETSDFAVPPDGWQGVTWDNVDPEAMVNPPEPPAKWQGSTRDDTPPAPEAPDLRTVGERVAECEQAIAALWDETGSESWNMRQLLGRVETLERTQAEIMARLAAVEGYGEKANYAAQMAARHEDRLAHLERVTHRLLNPGEQEGGE